MYSLEQLKIFVSVVETGSFSATGRKLNRAQSGISQAISNLETANTSLQEEITTANSVKDQAEGKVSKLEQDLETAKDATPEGMIEKVTPANMKLIRETLQAAGIEFIGDAGEGPGVRLWSKPNQS